MHDTDEIFDPETAYLIANERASDPSLTYVSPFAQARARIDRTVRTSPTATAAQPGDLTSTQPALPGGGPSVDRGTLRIPDHALANILQAVADVRAAGDLQLASQIEGALIQLGAGSAFTIPGRGSSPGGLDFEWRDYDPTHRNAGSFGVDPLGLMEAGNRDRKPSPEDEPIEHVPHPPAGQESLAGHGSDKTDVPSDPTRNWTPDYAPPFATYVPHPDEPSPSEGEHERALDPRGYGYPEGWRYDNDTHSWQPPEPAPAPAPSQNPESPPNPNQNRPVPDDNSSDPDSQGAPRPEAMALLPAYLRRQSSGLPAWGAPNPGGRPDPSGPTSTASTVSRQPLADEPLAGEFDAQQARRLQHTLGPKGPGLRPPNSAIDGALALLAIAARVAR